MGTYIIKFKNLAGEEGTIIPDVGFSYTDNLNSMNEAKIKISGSSVVKRNLIEIGSEVFIYRNTILKFHGMVSLIDFLDAGGMSITAKGYEIWLGKENGNYANSPWKAVASATIFNEIIAESSYFTAGTINVGVNLDFREEKAESLWNAINNLRQKTQQDIQVDYLNSKIDILDFKGSATSKKTFNAGIQIGNIRVSQSYPIGNDVRVWGKGNGENQIKSELTHGQSAASKTTYGTIRKIERDPSVMSVDEANRFADALVEVYENPVKIYDFEVLNPNQDLISGDVITLNAKSQQLNSEEVRITGIDRGIKSNKEYLVLHVTNKEYSRLLKRRNEILGEIQRNARDYQTYMQGTSNILTFGEMINAHSSAPLRIKAYLPESFIKDEAGNLRVNSFNLDYDIDPYRSGIGTASQSNVAPNVGGSSSSTQPGVSGSSSGAGAGVSGTGGSSGAGVSGTSSSKTPTSTSGTSIWSTHTVNYENSDYCSSNCYVYENLVGSPSFYTTRGSVYCCNYTGSSQDIDCTIYFPSGGGGSSSSTLSNNAVHSYTTGESNSDNESGWFQCKDANYNCTYCSGVQQNVYSHTHGSHSHGDGSYSADSHSHSDGSYSADSHSHGDGSYYANNHSHADGSYSAASHNHSVSIGDNLSDAGSINATGSKIYLDYWDGSSWVNKYSISSGNTIDTDVDLSNGGIYPDNPGFWQVRIYTDNASPDLVQGIIKCKHQLDN